MCSLQGVFAFVHGCHTAPSLAVHGIMHTHTNQAPNKLLAFSCEFVVLCDLASFPGHVGGEKALSLLPHGLGMRLV